MILLGRMILSALALLQLFATLCYDFDKRHVFHKDWPPHARFHAAAFALLNAALAIFSIWILWCRFELAWVAAILLALGSSVMFVAAIFPGVSIMADGERSIGRLPISLWMSGAYLVLVGIGLYLVH